MERLEVGALDRGDRILDRASTSNIPPGDIFGGDAYTPRLYNADEDVGFHFGRSQGFPQALTRGAGRFIVALTIFVETGRGDLAALEGQPGDYRLRVGGFRVLFHDDGNVVEVFHAASRGQVYK